MSSAVGIETKAAIRKALAWGTAKACGVNHGLLILPGNIKKTRQDYKDDSLGQYFSTDSDNGEIKAEGDIQAYLRYDSLDLLIAQAMGSSGSPVFTAPLVTGTATGGSASTLVKTAAAWVVDAYANKYVKITAGTGSGQCRRVVSNTADTLTVDVADGNWTAPDGTSTFEVSNIYATHPYDLADSLDGLFLTYCINNNINIEEFPTLKLTGFSITGGVGQPVKTTFKGIAYDKTTASVVNTLVTFANVTYRETANRVLYNQGVIRMNAQGGIALADGDKITPKTFTLDYTRAMRGEYGLGTFNYIDEPTNDGPPNVTLSLEFPRYTANTYFTDWDANNRKKLDMTFTGAGSRSCKLEFPNLKIQDVDLPLDKGILKHPVKFDCLAAAAAPTGMTVTKPFRLTMVNTYCGDPLQIGN